MLRDGGGGLLLGLEPHQLQRGLHYAHRVAEEVLLARTQEDAWGVGAVSLSFI